MKHLLLAVMALSLSACSYTRSTPTSPAPQNPRTNCKTDFLEVYKRAADEFSAMLEDLNSEVRTEKALQACKEVQSYSGQCYVNAKGMKTLKADDFSEICQIVKSNKEAQIAKKKTTAVSPDPAPAAKPGSSSVGRMVGKVLAPNGTDPVPEATVYLPKKGNENLSVVKTTPSGDCVSPTEPYVVYTCTDASGDFTFEKLSEGQAYVKVFKGPFSVILSADIKPDQTTKLAAKQTTLPKVNSATGTTAKIAVVKGSYDHMETVLSKLGVTNFDLVNSTTNLSGNLSQYDMVVINCGTSGTLNSSEIQSYVKNGGKLFVTDQSSKVIESAFPDKISTAFSGGKLSGFIAAKIKSGVLDAWLAGMTCGDSSKAYRCFESNGEVKIGGFMSGWAQIKSISPEVKTWVATDQLPLTVTFEFGKGRVFYSSYHTHHANTGAAILPQERILQYFLLKTME